MPDNGITYIGARYVPKFADPTQWDDTRTYEPLTIVTNSGASYTSKQYVPAGIALTNTDYWVVTGNYNAQFDALYNTVQGFDSRITTLDNDLVTEADERHLADNDLQGQITRLGSSITEMGVDIATAQTTADEALAAAQVARRKTHIAFIGDSFSDQSGEVAQKLASNLGYQLINKAAAGAGFTTGSYRFGEQLADLIIDSNFENVDTIFVYGGVNDWNDASATVTQMQTAFGNFKSTYLDIPAANRPKLIFAFGNVGVTTLAQYDGFLQWYRDCSRVLRTNVGMPGVVDNVCMWLMGFNPSSVFNNDNLHPTETGARIIASYLMSCFTGGYNGVFRQFEGTSSYGAHITVTFTNGIIGLSVKGSSIDLPNTSGYTNIGNVGTRQLKFGGDNSSAANQDFMTSTPLGIYADAEGHTAQRQLVFNARNGNLYVQNFGTTSLIPTTGVNIDTCIMGYPIS